MSLKYRTSAGDVLDHICWRHYLGGSSETPVEIPLDGIVEQVLEANPRLADMGPSLPAGQIIELPDIQPRTTDVIRLWD
jgi:phage tail protein X